VALHSGYYIEGRIVSSGNFYPHHRVQTSSGADPVSYPMSTAGVKRPGRDTDPVPRLRMHGDIPPFPQYVISWCLIKE
jgi:hypothetical protein